MSARRRWRWNAAGTRLGLFMVAAYPFEAFFVILVPANDVRPWGLR